MKLSKKRCQFSHRLALLILHAEQMGYHVAVDDVKRQETCSHGHPRSTHRVGLAADLLLYDEDWNYLTDPKEHELLHDYWDLIGGSRRIENDMNHYSTAWKGVR